MNGYTMLLVAYLFVHVTSVCTERSKNSLKNMCLLIRSVVNLPSPVQAQCQA